MRTVLLCALLAALIGCGSHSACPKDFAAFGEQEARAGKPASLPGPDCQPDASQRSAYFDGRGAGLRWFCAGPRLFEEARLGRSPDIDVCPLDHRETARVAQRTGEELLAAQRRRSEAKAQADAHHAANRVVEASEAELVMRVAEADTEQLRGLAIEHGWLPNPAVSGTLPEPAPGSSNGAPSTPPLLPPAAAASSAASAAGDG